MPDLGAILTAMVTPFDANGDVDDDAPSGSCATSSTTAPTAWSSAARPARRPTLGDEEHLSLIGLAVQEMGDRCTIVAGTGSNDTRHAVHLTERATELGADAVLSVTPYYNRPNRARDRRPLRARCAGRPTSRCCSTTSLAHRHKHAARPARRLGQIEASPASSRPTTTTLRPSTVWTSTPATTTHSRARSTSAAPAACSSPATSSASRCAAWSTSPSAARRSTPRCATSTRSCS